jgi:hypothetical protein
MATKAKSGKHSAPADVEATSQAERNDAEIIAEAKVASISRRKRPPLVKDLGVPSAVVTLDERLKKLSRLPSLQKPIPEPEPVIQSDPSEKAIRPPDPSAPLPEPEPSKHVDRGSTIPENYGLDRLAVLPRDPHWLFAYWELHGGALERLRFHHSAEIIDNARWVLRVRPANESGHSLVDIDLRAGQWYLNVAADARLTVDLGFVDQQGHFVEVVKGCTVTTPRAGISAIGDERWMILRDELEKLLRATSAEALSIASSDRPPLTRSEQPRAVGIFSSHLFQQENPGA